MVPSLISGLFLLTLQKFYRNSTQLDNTVAAVAMVDFLESEFKADRRDIFITG